METDVFITKGLCDKVARIVDIFEALLLSPPPLEQWPEWMARITALLIQYENVVRELRPTLSRHLLIPNQVGNNSEAIPNVLLRTRLPPEVEAYLKGLETDKDTGGIFKALGQILQSGADAIRPVPHPPVASLPAQDEELLVSIKNHYTA